MKHNARAYRDVIAKNLRSKASKNPMQNMLIILVESGTGYLGFQVSLPRLTYFVQLTVQRTDRELGSDPCSVCRNIWSLGLCKYLWIPYRKHVVDSTSTKD